MNMNKVLSSRFIARKKRLARSVIKKIRQIDIQRHLWKAIIAAPMCLLIIYLAVFSQPRYVSESKVAVKRPNELDSSNLNFGLLLGASNPSSAEDSLYLKEYINSPDMLQTLDKKLNFHAFSQSGWDFLFHLPADITAERYLDYYRSRLSVNYDEKTGLLSIETQGFTPEFAQAFNQAVLKESERFINELSHKISREQMQFAEEQLQETKDRLSASKTQLLAYQNSNNVLDPAASAEAATTLVNTLIAKRIDMEAELRNLLTYLREDAPQVVSTKNAIKSLQAQIDVEQNKITAPDGKKLNSMAADFEDLKTTVKFDNDLYALALQAIEKTHLESARKLKTLSVISSPQLPQESRFPNVLYLLASWLLVCCLLFGTAKLLIAIIEDHKD